MSVAVVADLMARLPHRARHGGKALYVRAALEKSGGNPVALQDFQNRGCALARTVVEGEGDDAAVTRSVPDRRPEDGGRPPSDSPRHEGCRTAESGRTDDGRRGVH